MPAISCHFWETHFSRVAVNLAERLRERINLSIACNIFALKGRRGEREKTTMKTEAGKIDIDS